LDGCDRPPSRLALLSVGRGTRCPPLGEGGEYLTRENPLHQPACPPPPHLNLSPPGRARRRRPPPPGSQLPPSLLPPEHDGGPFEFFFSVSCSVPLQHLSSIATGSADPSGLRLAPSLGGGKQALPYFGGLPFFCASNSAPKSVSLGWILKYAGCCDSCCCARGWLTSSSSSSVCVCISHSLFFRMFY